MDNTKKKEIDPFHIYESIVYGGADTMKLVEMYGISLQQANAIYFMDTSNHTSHEDDLEGIKRILTTEMN